MSHDLISGQNCLRAAFLCPNDFQDYPIVSQPEWIGEEHSISTDQIAQIPSATIIQDHVELINGLTQFYQTLVDMQYLREEDFVSPPYVAEQMDLSPLLSSGYTLETIALLLQLPHLTNDTDSFEIAKEGVPPFSYLCLSKLNTLSGENNPRGPLDHSEDLDWMIPPWMFFLTRPTPHRDGIFSFANCRIYDTRSKTLGLWSDSLTPHHHESFSRRFLMNALPPQQVFNEWIRDLRDLESAPSLSNGEGKIYTLGNNRELLDQLLLASEGTSPSGFLDGLIDIRRKEVNMYWAQRMVYEQCGWPDDLQSTTLKQRKLEWNEEVSGRSNEELRIYCRVLAGDNAA